MSTRLCRTTNLFADRESGGILVGGTLLVEQAVLLV